MARSQNQLPQKNDPRQLPHSYDAEKAVLGSIFVRPDILIDVLELVSRDCFYNPKHQLIFDVLFELHEKHEPIDTLTVTERLKELGKLDLVGGTLFVTDIASSIPTAANVKYYSEIIYNKLIGRRLIEASYDISEMGYAEADDVETRIDGAEKRVFDVSNMIRGNQYVQIKDEIHEAFSRYDRLASETGVLRGISSGLKGLDNKLSGFQKSDLIILAARPSVGKTAFALDIARKSAINHDSKVLIFSLEMASQQLVDRMLSAEASVDSWKLRTGKRLIEEETDRMRAALDRLSRAKIFIDDKPGNSILGMRAIARRIKREHGLDMIIIDYLQLMTPSGRFKNSDNLVTQVTEISRSLKILAREMDVPVIALSQLSRAVEQRGGRPRLSDLRDSGSIEQDADVVMFLHREDRFKEDSDRKNIMEILIEKHRNGPIGKVEFVFDENKGSYFDVDQSDFDSFSKTFEDDFAGF